MLRRPEMPTILEEEYEDDFVMPFKTSNFERSFEDLRVLKPNGSSFVYMYEIRWRMGARATCKGYQPRRSYCR